jgi:hypothetical protein
VWRTLAWIVGVRRDPLVELPERDAAGRHVGGPRYAPGPTQTRQYGGARRPGGGSTAPARTRGAYWSHVRAYLQARAAESTGTTSRPGGGQ